MMLANLTRQPRQRASLSRGVDRLAGPIIIGSLIGVICLGACTNPAGTSDQDIVQIQYSRLSELLGDPKAAPVVLVDVRTPEKYARHHIPNSINIPLPRLVADDPRLSQAKTIVVYASGKDDYLSPAAAKKLLSLGYKNVMDFRDGLAVWHNHQNQPITNSPQ